MAEIIAVVATNPEDGARTCQALCLSTAKAVLPRTANRILDHRGGLVLVTPGLRITGAKIAGFKRNRHRLVLLNGWE